MIIAKHPIALDQNKLDLLYEHAQKWDAYYQETGLKLKIAYQKFATKNFETNPRWYIAEFINTNGEYCLFTDEEVSPDDIDKTVFIQI